MRSTLTFTPEEMALFSAASHDRNPLHVSAGYARKTAYGEPVVFGALAALAALGRLPARPGRTLAALEAEFRDAIAVGVSYELEVESEGDRAVAELLDGRRTLMRLEARFTAGAPPDFRAPGRAGRAEAADRQPGDLAPGVAVTGSYAPERGALPALHARYGLLERGVGERDTALLCLASYVVGMELPGQRALFARLAFELPPADGDLIDYRATVTGYDERFELARLEVALASHGRPLGSLRLQAFVRADLPAPAAPVRSDAWAGKTALVTGGSRGLGAALVRALAWQGCTVYASYLGSRAEAEALPLAGAGAPGRIIPIEADAGDPAACERVRQRLLSDGHPLDLLVCSAFPPLRNLWIEPASAGRVERFLADAVRLVFAPLAAFLPLLHERAGQLALISSSAVSAPPPEWPHYVAAKLAAEGMVRVAAREYGRVRFLVARPPRLLTDLTNTPGGRRGTIPAEVAAAAIVARLMATSAPGAVEVLEEMDSV
jgi:NAD(P)-dependent dehydrogenase (short-subunit alcohol dehydrogenase family)